MTKFYMKKEDVRKQRPRLKVIRNVYGINDNMAKTYYVDLDTQEVFRVDERYDSIRKNMMGQEYDIVLALLDATSKTKQGDPCVHINNRLYTVARIMASTGLKNPSFYGSIKHKDGDRYNNTLENLEWCTHSELLKQYYASQKDKKPKKHTFKLEKEPDEQDMSIKTEAEKLLDEIGKDFDWDSIVWSE